MLPSAEYDNKGLVLLPLKENLCCFSGSRLSNSSFPSQMKTAHVLWKNWECLMGFFTHGFKTKKETISANSLKLWSWVHCLTDEATLYSKLIIRFTWTLMQCRREKGISQFMYLTVHPWYYSDLKHSPLAWDKKKCINV